jgi:hypothetical protein
MFGFLNDMDNYKDRKVDNYKEGGLEIDTARVSDGNQPYETGICHSEYNDGGWIIVEGYDNSDSAQEGHAKWVGIMTAQKLPEELRDCQNAEISTFLDGDDLIFKRDN